MGIVWEAYHKGVPCPRESLESPLTRWVDWIVQGYRLIFPGYFLAVGRCWDNVSIHGRNRRKQFDKSTRGHCYLHCYCLVHHTTFFWGIKFVPPPPPRCNNKSDQEQQDRSKMEIHSWRNSRVRGSWLKANFIKVIVANTLPETNSSCAPENQWLEDEVPFGMSYFQGLC